VSAAIGHALLIGGCIAVLGLLVVPIIVIIPLSFSDASYLQFPPTGLSWRWYRSFFERPDWIDATVLSAQVAVGAAAIATPLGTLAAFSVVRGRYPGKQLAQAFVVSPMVVPLIIVAIAFYFSFAKLKLTGTVWSLVLAHAVLAIPKVFLIMTAALRGIDPRLELAAMSLGASRPRAVLSVTLPLAKAALATSAILAFLTSFDEVVVAIFISGSTAVTLPKRMWDGIRLEYDPTITAVASLLITATVMTFVAVAALRARQPVAVAVSNARPAPAGAGTGA
jgi:ABC-type spermidine/putrescine transport system permease subunit II